MISSCKLDGVCCLYRDWMNVCMCFFFSSFKRRKKSNNNKKLKKKKNRKNFYFYFSLFFGWLFVGKFPFKAAGDGY